MKASQVLQLFRDLDAAVPYATKTSEWVWTKDGLTDCCEGCSRQMLDKDWFQGVLNNYQIPHDKVVNALGGKTECQVTGSVVLTAIVTVIDEIGI